MQLTTIFEDDYIVVLSKPSGLVVNKAESVSEPTVQSIMENKLALTAYNKIPNSADDKLFLDRSGMVHRLDKETSGVLLWAKQPVALIELLRQFRDREVEKEYRALVHGKIVPREGFVGVPIARDQLYRGRFTVDPLGKKAFTEYSVLDYRIATGNNRSAYSLLQLKPKTGRTHQLRVHLKHLGHPLVSDPLYLSKKSLKADLGWCPRLFLHAFAITFTHPITQKKIHFEVKLPDDLKNAIEEGSESVGK